MKKNIRLCVRCKIGLEKSEIIVCDVCANRAYSSDFKKRLRTNKLFKFERIIIDAFLEDKYDLVYVDGKTFIMDKQLVKQFYYYQRMEKTIAEFREVANQCLNRKQ